MANISTLTVSLVADTAKFTNGLKKGSKQSKQFAKAAKASAKAAAAAFAAMGVVIGALVVQSLKLVDAQRKTARTLGTSQATFAGLTLAAGIAGLSAQSFTKAGPRTWMRPSGLPRRAGSRSTPTIISMRLAQ